MAQKPLDVEQLRQAYEAVRSCGTIAAAAKSLKRSRSTFAHHWALAKEWAESEGLPIPRPDGNMRQSEPLPRLPQSADECWALLDGFIGRARKAAPKPGTIAPRKGTQRLVIASDFHAPFHDPWAVSELITRESSRTDTLIVGGDFTDSYSYSRFVKHEHISPEQEWAACDALLGQLSAAFPDIAIIQGNHDARLEKNLRAQVSPEIMFAIERLTDGQLDPMKAIAKRYKNVRFLGHKVGRHGVGWFTQYGDVIVSHAEKFSRVPGSALRSVDEWFTDRDHELGLKDWRVLLQAHTHAMGLLPWKADRLLGELGCLCEVHGYQLTARIAGRPQRRGYFKLDQCKGVTDLSSVRMVWLDPDRERKVA